MTRAAQLRALLATPNMVVAPGAFDAMTARLIEQAGFPAVYMTGAGTSFARGYPDLGLITMTEMVENAGAIASTVSIPVIADADTGYGNPLNVTRTVREFETRGVAGIHLEDQVTPKRCGHQEGKELVPVTEFLAKIRAALDARRDRDFMVIARTDARSVLGLTEAVDRANAALEAGADMVFVEALETLDELCAVPRQVRGPCMLNVVRGGRTPDLDLALAESMGYRVAILPSLLLFATIEACDASLEQLRATGAPPSSRGKATLREILRRFGTDEWQALDVHDRSKDTASHEA